MAEIDDVEIDYKDLRKYYREKMKVFNITKKYFKSIYAYVWCEICNDIIPVEINKEDIRNGLQTGLFIHKHTHINKNKDPEETEDKSDTEHTVMIYIDAKYDVRGVRTFFGRQISSEELDKGARIPIVVKEIPAMSVHLGMLSPEEYKILLMCDGNATLEDVAEISGFPIDRLEKMMVKLKEKGLIYIIRRT